MVSGKKGVPHCGFLIPWQCPRHLSFSYWLCDMFLLGCGHPLLSRLECTKCHKRRTFPTTVQNLSMSNRSTFTCSMAHRWNPLIEDCEDPVESFDIPLEGVSVEGVSVKEECPGVSVKEEFGEDMGGNGTSI